MPEHFEMFNQFITKFVEFTEAELVDLNNKCTKVAFSKGSVIMKAGEVQKNLFFITKGIIRNYVENNKGECHYKVRSFISELYFALDSKVYNKTEHFKAWLIQNEKNIVNEHAYAIYSDHLVRVPLSLGKINFNEVNIFFQTFDTF